MANADIDATLSKDKRDLEMGGTMQLLYKIVELLTEIRNNQKVV